MDRLLVDSARHALRAVVIGLTLGAGWAHAQGSPLALSPSAVEQIRALVAEKESRTPAQRKIDSQLLTEARQRAGLRMASNVPELETGVVVDAAGLADVEIRARPTARLLATIKDQGGDVERVFEFAQTIDARVPLDRLEAIAADPAVMFIATRAEGITSRQSNPLTTVEARQAARKALRERVKAELPARLAKIGSRNSQGDVTHRAAAARTSFGVNGAGVRICVLSDSFNNLGAANADIAAGDLPGPGNPNGFTTPVTLVGSGDMPSGGSDEGRAMLQIVHDLAPGAQLFYATAFNSITDFANNVRIMGGVAASGNLTPRCDIIIDDIFYFVETGLHDGQPAPSTRNMAVVTQAVNEVTAAGALFFSSAGNSGNFTQGTSGAYEGDFVSGTRPVIITGTGDAHAWNGTDVGNTITSASGPVTMQWSDPIGGSSNDYDLFRLDSTLSSVLASSTNVQDGTQDPFEQVTTGVNTRLVVVRRDGAAERFISLSTNRGRLQYGTTGQTRGHSAAATGFGVAATPAAGAIGPAPNPTGPFPNPFNATNVTELFSSDGPRRSFFNASGAAITPGNFLAGTNGGVVRQEPDFTAADGVETTLPSGSLNPFFGTSAAAPHAGAIAALVKQAAPTATPAQIANFLTSTALDIGAPGVDSVSGVGILQAFQAVQATGATPMANLALGALTITTGNNRLDPDDCNSLNIQLRNDGAVSATAVSAVLSSATPGVLITQASSNYPDIAVGGLQSNLDGFQVSTGPGIPQGSNAQFSLTVTYAGAMSPVTFNFSLPVGVDTQNYVFSTGTNPGIPAGGTPIPGSAADDVVVTTTAPFALTIYGTTIPAGGTISVSTNGNLQLVSSGGVTSLSNVALPGVVFPNSPVLFPYWDDLILTTPGGGIYTHVVGSAPNRQYVVEWRGRRFGDGATTQNTNVAIVFFEGSNRFEYLYNQTGNGFFLNGISATVGVQAGNTASSFFTQYSLNSGVITPGLRLSAAFPVGEVGTGVCAALLISETDGATVVAEGGATDTYEAVLTVAPTSNVMVTMAAGPQLSTSPSTLTFTSTNWNVPQQVTVTALDDAVAEGNHGGVVANSTSSADPAFNGINRNVTVSITDNDVAGITVTPTTGLITTESGGTATFTVVLTSQPSAGVTLGLSSSDTSEGTVAPNSLTFTSANWNLPQTVTVTGSDDVIVDGNVGYTIVTAPASSADASYAGFNAADVSVSNTDNDVAGITVTPTTGLITTEAGGTATFTVVLTSQPSAEVTLGLSSSDTSEGTVAPNSLTFTSANWNVAQTVTVAGVDDVLADGNVGYTIVTAAATSSDSSYSGINASDVNVTNTDNDVAGITVAPIAGLTTTEAGGTATFTVVLNTQPSANVTIGLSSNDPTEGSVSLSSLSFTSANWNTPQTVTVTGIDDAVVDGGIGYLIVTAPATSSDPSYSGVDAEDVSVVNSDNDIAGITVTPTTGLNTTEAGGTASFTVVLTSQPTADVTIGLSSSDATEGAVSPTSLTFTSANWNTAQTVTVTGVDDAVVDGSVAYSIVTAPAFSFDQNYVDINAADVSVTNTDNDVAGITVTPTTGLTTTEAGGTATFTVVLSAQPTADVTIGLSSSDTTEGAVSPTSLTFTSANWNVPRTVTVAGVDDVIVDGTVGYTILTAPATSADPAFAGFNAADVSVSNADNDVAGVTVTQSGGNTAVTEGGATDTYTLVLTSQPTANVVVAVSPNAQLTTAPTSVTFTAVNWNVAQTVTVTAVDDANAEGTHSGSVAHTVTSADTNYNGITVAGITATITDNDNPGVTVTQSGGNTAVTEGGATDTYTLVLTSQPTANVTVSVNPNAQLTTSVASVSFTSANWNLPQTVTVTAVDDNVAEGNHSGTVSHTVTSADAAYNGVTVADVTASISDNDLPTLSINDVSVTEGNSGTATLSFTVTRTGATTSAAGFSFATANGTATAGSDYVAASGTGSIPAGGASGTTTVSVTINGDAVFENNETLFVNLSAPTNATIGDGQGIGTITNDDTAPTLSINDVSIVEGNTGTSNLVFTVTRTGLTELPATFTATTADGTATAPSDYLAALTGSTSIAAGGATGTTTLTATINGDAVVEPNETFFVNLTAPVNATISDNQGIGTITNDDVAGITVTQSNGSTAVTEGGATDSYTLVLTSQPTADVVIALTSGTQLTATPSPVTFTPTNWNQPQSVMVSAVDDAIAEGTHNGSVSHAVTSGDANYQGRLVDSVSVTITDNDVAGVTVTQLGGNTAVTEGGATDTVDVVLSSQPLANVTVTITPNAQLTVSPSPLTFTAANWNVAQVVTVTAANDVVVEGTHNGTLGFAVASTDPAYAAITLPGITAAVTDNDSAVVSFAPASVSQSEATSPMAFTVTLSNPVASGVTVKVDSADGTATTGPDYSAIIGGSVSFAPNSTTAQTVNVTVTNDALDEDNETYTLTLSGINATGDVTLGIATATGTIEDDDALPVLSVSNVTQPEGNASNTLTFTVNLSPVSGRAVSFTRATQDGSAVSTGPNADFVAIPASTVTIPAGQTSLTIPVTINGDTVFEGDQSFTLSVTDVANATPGSLSATATLTDDDQQPTTTTIVSDLPDPSVVGQPYPVTVEVRAQTLSPLGTVSITDGSGASCDAPLTAGTPPLSTMTCTLTSTSAGARTLTASYTPANDAFAASSDTESHTVNAAATSLVLLGPARARIGTAASYTAELSVTAPGAGTPAGVVTVSSGPNSCTITLPTATPSCTITYASLGSRSVSAVFAPGNGNFTGSTATPVQTLVFSSSDVSVTKTNAVGTYRPGDLLVYTVIVRNNGPDAAPQVRVRDVAPAGLTNVAWTCEASGGAICPDSGGTGTLDHVVATLPTGGTLTYAYFGNVTGRPAQIVNTAEVILPADTTIEDPNPANNSATDTDLLDDLFTDGFEAPSINAETGGVRLAGASLRSTFDDVARVRVRLSDVRGEALRVYVRVVGGELQVALALRAADGTLRLGSWQRPVGDAELTWTATPTAGGFVLSGATLR